ncbi:hypothetical protein BKA62DRAFT_676714 [Auriculariales sp. MPI-PUGE-AT-0066]|nr:hypothetical protein BKA62DRAFT_676714 [Auriculariales sp. MPI-PUGE-AT-0066]
MVYKGLRGDPTFGVTFRISCPVRYYVERRSVAEAQAPRASGCARGARDFYSSIARLQRLVPAAQVCGGGIAAVLAKLRVSSVTNLIRTVIQAYTDARKLKENNAEECKILVDRIAQLAVLLASQKRGIRWSQMKLFRSSKTIAIAVFAFTDHGELRATVRIEDTVSDLAANVVAVQRQTALTLTMVRHLTVTGVTATHKQLATLNHTSVAVLCCRQR